MLNVYFLTFCLLWSKCCLMKIQFAMSLKNVSVQCCPLPLIRVTTGYWEWKKARGQYKNGDSGYRK